MRSWFHLRRKHEILREAKQMLATAIVALSFAIPAAAQTVIDGDTIKLNGTTYRLWGIDAPETKQECPDGWLAGRLAATHLQLLISGRTVQCERKNTDRYGRTVAICRAGDEDLGAIMVREGLAWAFIRYSADYTGEEDVARKARLGVHGHDCLPAWHWRAAERAKMSLADKATPSALDELR